MLPRGETWCFDRFFPAKATRKTPLRNSEAMEKRVRPPRGKLYPPVRRQCRR